MKKSILRISLFVLASFALVGIVAGTVSASAASEVAASNKNTFEAAYNAVMKFITSPEFTRAVTSISSVFFLIVFPLIRPIARARANRKLEKMLLEVKVLEEKLAKNGEIEKQLKQFAEQVTAYGRATRDVVEAQVRNLANRKQILDTLDAALAPQETLPAPAAEPAVKPEEEAKPEEDKETYAPQGW